MTNLRKLLDAGRSALSDRDWELAVKIYRKIVRTDPKNASAWSNLGAAYIEMLEVKKARNALKTALRIQPNLIAALGNLANLNKQTGNTKAAEKNYRTILKHNADLARAWYELAYVKKFNVGDPDIETMVRLFEGEEVDASERTYLGFALGKAFEEVEEYDRAFSYIELANNTKRKHVKYKADYFERAINEIVTVFNRELFKSAKSCGFSSRRPIFVLGMPRSGTTLVEQIIASHPDVIGGGELENLGNLIQEKFPLFPLDVLTAKNAGYKELGLLYLKSLGSASKIKKHTTDKMPRNFLFIGMIALALPKAKIIHCLRSPLDTCVSCYALNFPSGQEFSYNQTELGTYYRLYRDLMEHWKGLLPDKIFDISYEKLVADPEKNVRAILDYCELSWDPRCLSFYQNSRQVLTASAAQVRQPVHQKSVRRWQRFAKGLAPLQEALGEYVDQV